MKSKLNQCSLWRNLRRGGGLITIVIMPPSYNVLLTRVVGTPSIFSSISHPEKGFTMSRCFVFFPHLLSSTLDLIYLEGSIPETNAASYKQLSHSIQAPVAVVTLSA